MCLTISFDLQCAVFKPVFRSNIVFYTSGDCHLKTWRWCRKEMVVSTTIASDLLWSLWQPPRANAVTQAWEGEKEEASIVQAQREQLVCDVMVLLEWLTVLRVLVLEQWEAKQTPPDEDICALLLSLPAHMQRLREWKDIVGLTLTATPPAATTTSDNKPPSTTTFFRPQDTTVLCTHAFSPDRHRTWYPARLFRHAEWPNLSPKALLHLIRSFLTTTLEDHLLPMQHASFSTECWSKLRFHLQALHLDMVQWQDEHDQARTISTQHRILRLLRPFSVPSPVLSLFFAKSVEKAHLIRVLCLHAHSTAEHIRTCATNIALRQEQALGARLLQAFWHLRMALQAFCKDLSVTGLQDLGQHEYELEKDVLRMANVCSPAPDVGRLGSPQRQVALRHLQLLCAQQILLWNVMTHEVPCPEGLLERIQALHKALLHVQPLLTPSEPPKTSSDVVADVDPKPVVDAACTA